MGLTDLLESEKLDLLYSNYGPSLFLFLLIFSVAPDEPPSVLTDLICFEHLLNFFKESNDFSVFINF